MLKPVISKATHGDDLDFDEMVASVNAIMQGKCEHDEMGQFLMALREKGESVSEVAGAALAMRQNMTRIQSSRPNLIDTCGTGGDGSKTFNISTAAAIVAAAAGANVAKHGNRGMTSKSGSADVLRELGVDVDASVEQVEACLDQIGICFCFAPLLHRSMKHVAAVRKELGVPTIFNMLGPLCNPAGAPHQLLGVGNPRLRPLLAEAMRILGTERSLVVCGSDGLDEVTISSETHATKVENGRLEEFTWQPGSFGMRSSGKETMLVDSPQTSARIITNVLDGEVGPNRDIVVVNAAAALWIIGNSDSPEACAKTAADAIDSGAARELLFRLGEISSK